MSSSDTELGAEVSGRLIAMFCHFFVVLNAITLQIKKGWGKSSPQSSFLDFS